ncbi:Hypothetical predicted protein [Octopus vulgaris]|uniref:Uncharacterized protein n=1 Tax=Octopus vulgaris TaxID=6645 RepID=A0AA36EZ35_OCTVU|nr:Hypothetical predicted protein [Octopus vulgaris]
MIQKIWGVIYIITVFTSIYAETDPCKNLPNISNAITKKAGENSVTVTCEEDFFGTVENETLQCENETWSESKIYCTNKQQDNVSHLQNTNMELCRTPPPIENTKVVSMENGTAEVTCKEGYKGTIHSEELTCEDGTWTESEINCTRKETVILDTTDLCGQEPNITNAKIEDKEGILEVSCLDGYKGTKIREEIKCQNGRWTESEINCTALSPCGEKPTVAHANLTQTEPGTLKVNCLEGYKGTHETEILTCQNKTWTQSEINCTDLCAILPNITNAEVELTKPGVAKVTCLEGYQGEIDEDEISCKNGIWEQEKISCTVQNVKKVSENQMLKFTQFLLSAVLHKNYLLCVFLTQNQTCDCLLGKLEFKKWEAKKIVSHNDERIFNISFEECSAKCKSKKWCVSFEYSEKNRICHLSKTAHYMLNQLLFVEEKSVNYYEKVCQNDVLSRPLPK